MNREHRVVVVVRAAERERDLELVELRLEARQLARDVCGQRGALVAPGLGGERGEVLEVRRPPFEGLPGLDQPLEARDAAHQRLRALGIIPEVGGGGLLAEPG